MERKRRTPTPLDIARRDSEISTTDMDAVQKNADDTIRARLQQQEQPERQEPKSLMLAARLAILRTVDRIMRRDGD